MSGHILITGGAGFIGTSLARRLAPSNELVLLDNLRRDNLTGTDLLDHPNVRFVHGSVLDEELLVEEAAGAAAIVHLAAIAGVTNVLGNPVETMQVNFVGTRNILEAALASASTVERIIEFSSSEVLGRRSTGAGEDEVTIEPRGDQRWSYAVSKLAGEYMAHAYYGQFDLPTVSFRLFNVYGPGQVGEGAVHTFVEDALNGRPLVIHNDGAQIRTWCYVDDVVDALVLALVVPQAVGQVFNIGDPRSVLTVRDLAERVLRAVGKDFSDATVYYEQLGYEDVDVRIPSIAKARELLGWEPKVGFVEGLERTVAWYRLRHDLQRATPSQASAGP